MIAPLGGAWAGRTSALHRPPIARITGLAAELAAEGQDVIDLGQAILGLQPPRAALAAARAYLEIGSPHAYSPDPGLPELREAIADFLRRRKGIAAADAGRVMVTCGANQAFANTLLAVTQPGAEVLTFGPGYFDHGYVIGLGGCAETQVALRARGRRFHFDLDAVEQAIGPRTRVVVLVSPGNPTAAVADETFVRGLCELCARRGLWLLSDETYDLLTFAPSVHCAPASVSGYERIVTIGSFSKIFGLAAWRVGYFLGSAALFEQAFKVQDALVVCAPVPSQLAARAALAELEPYVAAARAELVCRRDALLGALAACPWIEPMIPEGATFLLGRIARPDGAEPPDDVVVCEQLLRQAGLVTVPGSAFGVHGRGFVRLSFGNQPVDRIAQAGSRLAKLDRAGWSAP
jgi:aspartate/methionine/tyrosine aminotransferase